MASSLTSPGLRFAANQILMSLHKDIAKVSQFTTNFTADAAQKGSTLLIPVANDESAGDFNRSSNNYGHYQGSIRYVPMVFDKHKKHSFGFTENDFNLVNGTSFWQAAGEKSADAVGRAIEGIVAGLITKSTVKTSGTDETAFADENGEIKTGTGEEFSSANEVVLGTGDLTLKKVAGLRKACRDADIPVRDTILALNSVKFAELLSLLDAHMYGGTDAIRDGLIPNLYGYKAVMELDSLSNAEGENLVGALIPSSAIAVASRTLNVQNPKLYAEIGTVTDEKSGLVLQMRRGGDWTTGDTVATVECLFGAKLVMPTKVVRLVSAATVSGGSTGPTGD